jgi:hypothetical protein
MSSLPSNDRLLLFETDFLCLLLNIHMNTLTKAGAPETLFPSLISLVVLFLVIPHFRRAEFAILVKHVDVWHAVLDRL